MASPQSGELQEATMGESLAELRVQYEAFLGDEVCVVTGEGDGVSGG